MGERQQIGDQRQLLETPLQSPAPPSAASQPQTTSEEMIGCVAALEAALLPCLPARELQAIDRTPHPSHQMDWSWNQLTESVASPAVPVDVEKHARDFMEAAKKLQLYLSALQRGDQPSSSSAEMLRKDIAAMEEEVKVKDAIIKKQEQLIEGWRQQLKDQLDRHKAELAKV